MKFGAPVENMAFYVNAIVCRGAMCGGNRRGVSIYLDDWKPDSDLVYERSKA